LEQNLLDNQFSPGETQLFHGSGWLSLNSVKQARTSFSNRPILNRNKTSPMIALRGNFWRFRHARQNKERGNLAVAAFS
jgi:hypothetical protein